MGAALEALRSIPGGVIGDLRRLTLHGAGARGPFRAVLSVLLAVTVSDALELDDLSWSAFSGFMVMRADVAESLARGTLRVAGTIGGAAVGLVVAPAIADDPALLITALFAITEVATFGSLAGRHGYAWVFFGITAGLVTTEALADPGNVLHFAATRVAEIIVGTMSCLSVAISFTCIVGPDRTVTVDPAPVPVRRRSIEDWLEEHWPLLEHSTRSAFAVALLPLIWRWLEIQDFSQTAVTSFVVMIVPVEAVRRRRYGTISVRMLHRAVGCLLGSLAGLASLSISGNDLLSLMLILSAGVWIGYHVQSGSHGVGYVGTQFTLGLLVTLMQGPGPVDSILPGLDRLVGILIGIAALWLTVVLWPLPEER